MQYCHLRHAGNFADVFKHALLVWMLKRLMRNFPRLYYVESHAGAGTYRLSGTVGGADGIARLWQREPAPALADYLSLQRARQHGGLLRLYLGSPCLAAALLRPEDVLIVAERAAPAVRALRRRLAGRPATVVHHGDGFAFLARLAVSRQGGGLVLIDPPYVASDEAASALQAFRACAERGPDITTALWYPLQSGVHMTANVGVTAPGLCVELVVRGEARGMSGCGMLIARPLPDWEAAMAPLLDALVQALGQDAAAGWHIAQWS